MENTYKLIWSDEALTNLKQIILYLEEKWTTTEIKKFANLLDRQLFRIQNNPFLFPKSDVRENYRKAVLSKQTTIYYRVFNFEIHIVTLFDNRQDPKKIEKSNANTID